MKNHITLLIIMAYSLCFSLSLEDNNRENLVSEIISSGNITFQVSNNCHFGAIDDNLPSLEWPINSQIQYLHQGSLWIGAKKYRRNIEGVKLYWLEDPDDEDDVVAEGDYENGWTENLNVAIDTLTSVGYDGDTDLYELLPAYNPLEMNFLGEQYNIYSEYDRPIKSIGQILGFDDDNDGFIDEEFLGSEFVYPDPNSIYCYTRAHDEDNDNLLDEDTGEPGFQNVKTVSYDFSPFNNPAERDYGSYLYVNKHYPLNVIVEQSYYAWPAEQYSNTILLKNVIHNTSLIDTLYDFTFGYYIDPDIGPSNWNSQAIAYDDLSNFHSNGYNFPYSYDADGDNGLTPGYFGIKILEHEELNNSCWTWQVGQGPDDRDPRDLNSYSGTANEKYWLLTHNTNPFDDGFFSIIDEPIDTPNDTRYLYSIYGDMQGFDNPSANSLNIAPGESYEFYTVLLLGYSLEELENEVDLMHDFINSSFDYSVFNDKKSLPYLNPLESINNNSINITWAMLTQPDQVSLFYKPVDSSSTDWNEINISPNTVSYQISSLEENEEYVAKLGVYFDDIYLESNYQTINLSTYNSEESTLEIGALLKCYPNPFNPTTTIYYSLSEDSKVDISIYNIKGQKVKILVNESLLPGVHQTIWNSTDDNDKLVSSGVYLYKLTVNGKVEAVKRCLLLK